MWKGCWRRLMAGWKDHIVLLLWLIKLSAVGSIIMSVCHTLRVLSLACLVYLQSNGCPANLSDQVSHELCFQLFAENLHDLVLSLSASCCLSWNFLGMLSRWNSISAGTLQPHPVLSLHFSYVARQPSTWLSNVTSAWHCMVLPSLTSTVAWLTGVPHCSLTLIKYFIFHFFH